MMEFLGWPSLHSMRRTDAKLVMLRRIINNIVDVDLDDNILMSAKCHYKCSLDAKSECISSMFFYPIINQNLEHFAKKCGQSRISPKVSGQIAHICMHFISFIF